MYNNMEELLMKYQLGECNDLELKQIELLLSEDESLKATMHNIQELDAMAAQQLTMINLDSAFQDKLIHTLHLQVAQRAALLESAQRPSLVNLNEDNPFLMTYGGPILLTIMTLISIIILGVRQSTSEVNIVLNQYSLPMILGSICLIGWYAIDQWLSNKQSQKQFLLSI